MRILKEAGRSSRNRDDHRIHHRPRRFERSIRQFGDDSAALIHQLSKSGGQRTSKMTVREMKDLIELAYAFGNERGVEWSRTSLGRDA
ncbi:hypothetical protein GHR37_26390 [Achromobacter xylosoxidans]|nr:hypothetical protein [Achromobacter xylosoxidans]